MAVKTVASIFFHRFNVWFLALSSYVGRIYARFRSRMYSKAAFVCRRPRRRICGRGSGNDGAFLWPSPDLEICDNIFIMIITNDKFKKK
jgi:hypothetical protein